MLLIYVMLAVLMVPSVTRAQESDQHESGQGAVPSDQTSTPGTFFEQERRAVPRGSRPQGDNPQIAAAVPRSAPPPRTDKGTVNRGEATVIVPDVIAWPQSSTVDIGNLRLRVSPRDAQVFVDGYYAGLVDNYDGFFQALKLDSGTYRIEITAPGYETLTFGVLITPGQRIRYRGDLRRRP